MDEKSPPSAVSSTKEAPTHGSTSVASGKGSRYERFTAFLLRWGVETHGIGPVPDEQRTDPRLYQMFFVWFSANLNVLGFSTGSAGPAFFGLGIRHSLVIILIVDIIACAIPAVFAVFGPKLGTRGMVQARFSWGYFGSIIPAILNVFSMQGFLILNCIIGGQTLASVSHKLDTTAGIVIISVLSLVVTFFGYKVVHLYESIAWIPNVITFIVMLGIGGKHLHTSDYPTVPSPSAASILSFATFVASSVISWCTMTPDYGVYHDAKASSARIFAYNYFGFFGASISTHMIGAAFAAAANNVPAWKDGFEDGTNVGGLISGILSPAGGFGKFLIVIVSLSIPSACAPTMYTFGTSFMSIAPIFAKVPRYIFAVISEAILIPVAIVGARRFYGTLINILSIIGYWSTSFAAIVLVEHFVFRQARFSTYEILSQWDSSRKLPLGIAAVFAFICSFGIIVPSMSQAWFVGPLPKEGTGDIGVLTGFGVASVTYGLARALEKRFTR